MHLSIGAPSAMDANMLPQDILQGRFNGTLNGRGIVLHLPAAVIKAIIFYHKFQSAHIIWAA